MTASPLAEPEQMAQKARSAWTQVAQAGTDRKNAALEAMAERLEKNGDRVLAANREDLHRAEAEGLADNMLRRLVFDENKLQGRIRSLRKISNLPDPVGQLEEPTLRPNGLQVARMRVPLGVLLMIYEARPHVTVNGGAFALKSGNAILLRGGSEARECNAVLGELWRASLSSADLPENAIQVISGTHEEIGELLQLSNLIDVVIPRGGKGLIEAVVRQSAIPVIKHFQGICHVYVGKDADLDTATRIVLDSKLLMPEVCNAAECVLFDQSDLANAKQIVESLQIEGVEVRGCPRLVDLCPGVTPAREEDFQTEYLDLIMSAKVVSDIGEAIQHISGNGSGHTDAIVTGRYEHAQRFLREVDSSVVLVNASTMFCDGETLGMGAEIGISTDRLHARGPMGLRELTTYKFVIRGSGQVMGSG